MPKQLYKNICEIIAVKTEANVREIAKDVFCEIAKWSKDPEKSYFKLNIAIVKALKSNGIKSHPLRLEIMFAFSAYLDGTNYVSPFKKYLHLLQEAEKFQNVGTKHVEGIKDILKKEYESSFVPSS